ncbi:FIST C-terminal domain-containing protein [Dechloromonas sp. ZS-1]|uniref:FIST signal transduction protein n=1 Tax=Dechloromonas sp. ZS-1 TaxID=3138067 RepID=UPI0031FDFC5A
MRPRITLIDASPDALHAFFERWEASPSAGLLVLVPEQARALIAPLQSACRAHDIRLVGAMFPVLIHAHALIADRLIAIRLDPMPPAFVTPLPDDPVLAAETIAHHAAAHRPAEGAEQSLLLIFDAMLPKISSTMAALYKRQHGYVHYVGANAGSETFSPMPCLFDETQCIERGVLGLRFEQTQVDLAHGYPVAKTLMRAVSTDGNRILSIDGRPAMTVYREVILADFGVQLTPENFYDYAVHYPFGVIMASDVLVRIPVGFDDAGNIVCVGEIPPNSLLRLIQAPDPTQHAAAAGLGQRLRQHAQPDSLNLLFYCAGRRMHMGAHTEQELSTLAEHSGQTLLGALSLGEIAPLPGIGMPEFHNAAMLCIGIRPQG